MPDLPIEQLSAREIDALVAENIFDSHGVEGKCGVCGFEYTGVVDHCRPAFSTCPAASKQLRDKMRADGIAYALECHGWKDPSTVYTMNVHLLNGSSLYTDADTEERAVALAALKAKGVTHA